MAIRAKMSREERAKQFMPFAALKGYPEALRQKERIVVPKMELSEDYQETLDRKLHQVEKPDIVTVIYFQKNEYVEQTGMVTRIDRTARILKVVNTRILFDDIYDIVMKEKASVGKKLEK
ncbi:YolD-like family protein [Hespellia stercorisuis]|uniref:YolD-like protein n=1 Tax=Hespellia stercorisuis DSM 15480 TaxID=1121950 RepID=A0A1M6MTC3_9FIRM|nr:YolD-like family protein [Hespellia stercorisuis]SHJ86707.1 YolD-like protein [Hespellia stercorisuis DSM 15480]